MIYQYPLATDQSTRPETASTSGLNIAKAILQVFSGHLTTVAKGAGRKIKILKSLSQLLVGFIAPDMR